MMANYGIKKILIDNESLADILFYDAFQRIRLLDDRLKKVYTPLVVFFKEFIAVERESTLLVIARQEPQQATIQLTLHVVSVPSAYNAILG